MHDRDNTSDEIPDADAVEQGQETVPGPTMPDRENPPAEANLSDWQEQRQEIVGADDDDREEYR